MKKLLANRKLYNINSNRCVAKNIYNGKEPQLQNYWLTVAFS